MILYFTYESRDTLKPFTLLITQKYHETESKETSIYSIQVFPKLAVVVHVLQTTQNLVISGCCFTEDGQKMYQEL